MAPSPVTLDAALARLRAARRPVIIAGQGARGATHEITALAERLGAPVATTFRAKGLVPDTHPLGAGVLGRSGSGKDDSGETQHRRPFEGKKPRP